MTTIQQSRTAVVTLTFPGFSGLESRGKRLLKVLNDVIDMLGADGHADQILLLSA
jgi:hypothetical protein